MSSQSGKITLGTIILTSVLSILTTLSLVGLIIYILGLNKVTTEISPFVEKARELVPTTEVATPATEADEIMDGVAKNQGSSVLLYGSTDASAEFLGRGILVTANGYILTDASLVEESKIYSIAVPGSKDRFEATVEKVEDSIAVLKITISTSLVAPFSNNTPTVNDLVVAVTGDAKMSIGTGIVTKMTDDSIITNIYGTIAPGSVLIAKSGYAIGISTAQNQKAGEAAFTILTKADISRLTTPSGGE